MSAALTVIREHAEEGAKLRLSFFENNAERVDAVALALARCLAKGGKVLICGNGGSAADAQHMSGEFLGRFVMERPSLPAVALSVDSSTLTAVGNDYGFDDVFARQVQGLGRAGDALVAFSTSGKSSNIIRALEAARSVGMLTVGLTRRGGGLMPPLCDYLLDVPCPKTPLIQEIHEACLHLVCGLVDHYLFREPAALRGASD